MAKNGQNCALFAFIRLYFVPSVVVLQLFFVEAAGLAPAWMLCWSLTSFLSRIARVAVAGFVCHIVTN